MPSLPWYGQKLSPREAEVLTIFCDCCETQKEVARKLRISHRTVERHMQNAMVKLGAPTQQRAVLMWGRRQAAEAARIAIEEALASLDAGMVRGAADTLREALSRNEAETDAELK